MKHFSKQLALLLAILTLIGVLGSTFVGCKNDKGGEETTGTTQDTAPDTGKTEPSSKTAYTITVQSAGGMKLEKATIVIYADETLADMVAYGSTNAEGKATIEMPRKDGYVAVVSTLPDGYNPAPSYPLTGTDTTIEVTSSVIDSTDHAGIEYKLGDVIRDFEVTDVEGKAMKLSDLLKEKKMVLINFWYIGCSWCEKEFPYMNSAYDKYKDDIEIVALNHNDADSEDAIKLFRDTSFDPPLAFPLCKDYTGIGPSFRMQVANGRGYPTSIIVDRYGVICVIEEGGIVSEEPFIALFDHFTAENYEQKLITSVDDLVERPKPNVEMPSSEEINRVFSNGLTATFSPETNEKDAEYSWPFVITKKDGVDCITNSNTDKNTSYATMYATVSLKKGEALAFDYWASSEQGADVLYLLAKNNSINKDTYKDIYQISGVDTKWNTCYTYVAAEDGEYSIGFCFVKDSSDKAGDDRVYLKNLRIVKESAIDVPTYIPRYAASDRTADGSGYNKYVTVVFNESDGLYHVGTKDGPLLLANLMSATRFSDTGLYYFALDGKFVLDGKDYSEDLLPYASYASNSALSGMCSVDQGLKEILEAAALALGIESDNPNQWLQMCSYYDAYGTNGVQLQDPVRGLSTSNPFTAVEGDENEVYYDRMIMPRGLLYEFIPTKSGAYRITSHSTSLVEGWIMLADETEYYVYEGGERLYTDENNVSMVVYMEAGTPYYIDICFYDVYEIGGFKFSVDYLGESYDQFHVGSPGFFTFPEGSESGDSLGELAEILAGGINIKLGDDGYYHELREDGTLGSILYADFLFTTSIFGSENLQTLIDKGAFDFSRSESDEYILDFVRVHGDDTKDYLKKYWGTQYDELAAAHNLDEVLAGKLHGSSKDKTEQARSYIQKMIALTEENPELEGCVPVDAELGALLQELMDKYTFPGVDHSWTKICYYYRHVGA